MGTNVRLIRSRLFLSKNVPFIGPPSGAATCRRRKTLPLSAAWFASICFCLGLTCPFIRLVSPPSSVLLGLNAVLLCFVLRQLKHLTVFFFFFKELLFVCYDPNRPPAPTSPDEKGNIIYHFRLPFIFCLYRSRFILAVMASQRTC